MIQSKVLAGAGDSYARLSYREGNRSYALAVAGFYGAHVKHGPATLEISNGDYTVVLDLSARADALRPDRDNALGATQFSAPILHVPSQLSGFRTGQRIDVLLLPMADYDFQNPRAATQAVMHTTRDLHGPGPYPGKTRWGAWINGYRAEAAGRAATKASWKAWVAQQASPHT